MSKVRSQYYYCWLRFEPRVSFSFPNRLFRKKSISLRKKRPFPREKVDFFSNHHYRLMADIFYIDFRSALNQTGRLTGLLQSKMLICPIKNAFEKRLFLHFFLELVSSSFLNFFWIVFGFFFGFFLIFFWFFFHFFFHFLRPTKATHAVRFLWTDGAKACFKKTIPGCTEKTGAHGTVGTCFSNWGASPNRTFFRFQK